MRRRPQTPGCDYWNGSASESLRSLGRYLAASCPHAALSVSAPGDLSALSVDDGEFHAHQLHDLHAQLGMEPKELLETHRVYEAESAMPGGPGSEHVGILTQGRGQPENGTLTDIATGDQVAAIVEHGDTRCAGLEDVHASTGVALAKEHIAGSSFRV